MLTYLPYVSHIILAIEPRSNDRAIQRITPQDTPSSASDSDGDWGSNSKKKSGSRRRRTASSGMG
jgi:hypothetical protein